MNSWSFTGNLGQDREMRSLPNGDPIVSFSVGVKSGYGDKATTTWARCAMFGKRADAVSQYLLKGQQVGVVGEISMREWDDRQGQKRTSLEVRVSDLTLLGKRGESGSGAPSQPPQQQSQPQTSQAPQHTAATGGLDDDVPFMRAGHGALWRCM